ncbi:hypothetical protein DFO73_104350 [Cytobacillus oceanisediminis]|uniref:Uncharacterized protein n=1 Tax=Cytobacillus oceanisediminis TaxID=665099 RepID=A0A2V3A8B2_9BACI|nr:hypothetical protein [Cytobacillus oceanisediminis]PWW29707.1 hypothetical protein DFO73_104350 [Cytobacillus oceanisediminis]
MLEDLRKIEEQRTVRCIVIYLPVNPAVWPVFCQFWPVNYSPWLENVLILPAFLMLNSARDEFKLNFHGYGVQNLFLNVPTPYIHE